jgi:hypothetical protein
VKRLRLRIKLAASAQTRRRNVTAPGEALALAELAVRRGRDAALSLVSAVVSTPGPDLPRVDQKAVPPLSVTISPETGIPVSEENYWELMMSGQ